MRNVIILIICCNCIIVFGQKNRIAFGLTLGYKTSCINFYNIDEGTLNYNSVGFTLSNTGNFTLYGEYFFSDKISILSGVGYELMSYQLRVNHKIIQFADLANSDLEVFLGMNQ